MEMRAWSPRRAPKQDLSKSGPLHVGPLHIHPSLRTIANGSRVQTLEPRIMRVLVALVEAKGRVLSRDDLIETCWDGQIVGDNAINRIISQLRKALAELAGEAVVLETVIKVGFRLVVTESAEPREFAAAEPPPVIRSFPRRKALAGCLAAAGLVGAVGVSRWQPWRHRPDPAAVQLVTEAQLLMKSAGPGTTQQGLRMLERAVRADPDYADAWGALAITYRHALDGFSRGERSSYPQMLESAAQRALALDPDQPDARLARIVCLPHYRRAAEIEPQLRTFVARYPDHWFGQARLGILLRDVGRFDDALGPTRRAVAIDPELPIAWANLAANLLAAGRVQEADSTLDEAFRRWVAHPALWLTRFHQLLTTRRYADAASFARDTRSIPDALPEALPQALAALGDGLTHDDPAKLASGGAFVRTQLVHLRTTPLFAPILVLLRQGEAALDASTTYFAPQRSHLDRLEERSTSFLVAAPMTALVADPRHAALLALTGLEAYWRRSGSQPDFRRG
jgi:DNA-binding winged helix-turn-helix (wHTH) protein/tetratricopeptide (TPR) repeat protein